MGNGELTSRERPVQRSPLPASSYSSVDYISTTPHLPSRPSYVSPTAFSRVSGVSRGQREVETIRRQMCTRAPAGRVRAIRTCSTSGPQCSACPAVPTRWLNDSCHLRRFACDLAEGGGHVMQIATRFSGRAERWRTKGCCATLHPVQPIARFLARSIGSTRCGKRTWTWR